MVKICTSIEQSKKLVKLGLDVNTADMCYKCLGEDPYDLIVRPYSDWKEEYKGLLISGDANVIPAWSLSALLELMPNTIQDEDGVMFGLNIKKNFVEYYNPSMGALYATYHCITAEDTVDAAFEMICWLLENKKI